METERNIVVGVRCFVAHDEIEHVGSSVEHADGGRGNGSTVVFAVRGRDDGVPGFTLGGGGGRKRQRRVGWLRRTVLEPSHGRSAFCVPVIVAVGVGHREVVGGIGGGWRDEDVAGHRVGVGGNLFCDADGVGVVVVAARTAVAVSG